MIKTLQQLSLTDVSGWENPSDEGTARHQVLGGLNQERPKEFPWAGFVSRRAAAFYPLNHLGTLSAPMTIGGICRLSQGLVRQRFTQGEGDKVFLTGTIITFKMIATDGRTKNWSDPVLAYQNKVLPDWEPDENPAHHVYARSAANPARYDCAQAADCSGEFTGIVLASFDLHDAGQFSLSGTKPNRWSFFTNKCPATHSPECGVHASPGRS